MKIESQPSINPDLLALDEDSVVWRARLARLAHHMYLASLSGPSIGARLISRRLESPRAGDYIYEANAIIFFWPDNLDALAKSTGMLLNESIEPSQSDEEWIEEIIELRQRGLPIPDRPTERVYYLRYGPDDTDVCRWTNARMMVVPLESEAGPALHQLISGYN